MTARDHRLRRDRDFQAVWQSRWAVRLPQLTLRFARRPDSPGRIGIVVSRAVAKKATDRNRLKRRLRNILIHQSVPSGIDAALITQRGAPALTYAQLTQSVQQLFDRAFTAPRGHRRPARLPSHPVT